MNLQQCPVLTRSQKWRVGVLVVLGLLSSAVLATAGAGDEDPKTQSAPDWYVFRPTFSTTEGEVRAGTAFFIRLPDHSRPLLLTALHLLGPAGGMPKDVPPTEVPKVVKRLRLTDCFQASRELQLASEPLVIAAAAPARKPGKAGDVLAFWGPSEKRTRELELATKTPGQGERVWLVASLRSGAPPEQWMHPAVLVGINKEGEAIYRFDNLKMELRATSGAPVLNKAGQVVAIHLGGGAEDGKLYGFGNPVERFRPHLETAAKQSSKP